jgi:hypothetical protein
METELEAMCVLAMGHFVELLGMPILRDHALSLDMPNLPADACKMHA